MQQPRRSWLLLIRQRRWLRAVALGSFMVLMAGACHALDRAFADLHHTAYRGDDGAPANVVALAQTTDGYLWLGTGGGLYRFDGVRFDPVRSVLQQNLRAGSISALYATPSGQLLIGHRFGGVSILDRSGIQHHALADGMLNAWGFAVEADGAIWGAFTGGVARLRGGAWQVFELDGASIPFRSTVVDPQGNVWVTARTGAYVLSKGADAFRRVEAALPSSALLSLAPDGQVWATDVEQRRAVPLTPLGSSGRVGDARRLPPTANRLWFDSQGAMWLKTSDGVARMKDTAPPTPKVFGALQGLSGAVQCWLEDREGNVWVGTAGGLDRFRRLNVRQIDLGAEGGNVGVAAADGGRVWATAEFGGLFRVGDAVEALPRVARRATHIHRDRDGVVWIGTRDALWRIMGDDAVAVTRPDAAELGRGIADAPIHAIAKDRSGVLWVLPIVHGAYRRLGDEWIRVPRPTGSRIMSMGNDSEGRLWIGYWERGAARIDGDEVLSFTQDAGLRIGPVIAIFGRGERVWLGGQQGVALFDGRTMKTLALRGLEDLSVVTGIVETASGELWIHAANGLTKIEAVEWRRAVADPDHRVRYQRFDSHDGLHGAATVIRPVPTLIEGGDGRLWAATSVGLFVIDPKRLHGNPLAPPVIVQSLTAGGRRFDSSVEPDLRVGDTDLRIAYTATSLTIPQRVRFRYKLEGYDTGWQDAGGRREAAYTKVGPGRYVFRVMAANNDGVWNEEGASLAFTVPPAFWQTRWFTALVLLCLTGLLWALVRLRIRQVAAQLRARMESRLQERERIARELHDTLIQSVTGLTLQVRAAANQAEDGSPLRLRLETALARANETIVEGRDRVIELRTTQQLRSALAATLDAACRGLAQTFPGPHCQVSVSGNEREVNAVVAKEVESIAREAMANALRHASSESTRVALHFDADALRLFVRDDGVGFDVTVASPGRFGLAGMRERAKQAGGELRIRSGPSGTEVALIVPAAAAYCRPGRFWRWPRLRTAGASETNERPA